MDWRRRRPARTERGAVAIEAALILPVLLLLVFGIVEMAFLMKDDVAVTSAVRAGGRTASANAGAGPGGVADGSCVSPCSPANAPMFAQLAANTIQRAGAALPKDSILELWVYKANDKGYPGGTGLTTWSCSTDCVRYKWVKSEDAFRYFSGTWLSKSVNACANNSPDSVGIYLKIRHSFTSGIFKDHIDLEDHSVFAFEPLPTTSCAANAPGRT